MKLHALKQVVALLALLAVLAACADTPKPSRGAIWDQSNFETATWN